MADATFEIRKDSAGKYRWHLEAPNHRITADSGQGYESKSACETAIGTVKSEINNAKVVDKTGS